MVVVARRSSGGASVSGTTVPLFVSASTSWATATSSHAGNKIIRYDAPMEQSSLYERPDLYDLMAPRDAILERFYVEIAREGGNRVLDLCGL